MWVALRGRPGRHERTGFNNFLAKAAVSLLERSEEYQPVTTGTFGFRDYSGGHLSDSWSLRSSELYVLANSMK